MEEFSKQPNPPTNRVTLTSDGKRYIIKTIQQAALDKDLESTKSNPYFYPILSINNKHRSLFTSNKIIDTRQRSSEIQHSTKHKRNNKSVHTSRDIFNNFNKKTSLFTNHLNNSNMISHVSTTKKDINELNDDKYDKEHSLSYKSTDSKGFRVFTKSLQQENCNLFSDHKNLQIYRNSKIGILTPSQNRSDYRS